MEWEKHRLEDLAITIQTGPFGSQLHQSDYSESGTPVIMPKDMVDGKITTDSIARVAESHVQRLKRHKVETGDIIYSRRGDVGRCSLITEKEDGWLCGTGCLKVKLDKKKCIPSFLFYILQRKDSVGWVENHAVGATMPNLNTDILSRLPVKLPSIEGQHCIASILSAYDELIEVNTKRIKVLEQMAENLYKEWFVRFRFPGHETAEFENGLPKGWEYRKLDKLLDVRYGKDHKSVGNGDIPVFGSGGLMRFGDKALYNGEVVLIPRKGSLNNIMYYNASFWTVDTMFYAVPLIPNFVKFAYYLLSNVDMESYNSGAALPSMTTDILYHFKILVPNEKVLTAFDRFVSVVFDQKQAIQKAIENLIKQRDLLLPRLMSGKLEI